MGCDIHFHTEVKIGGQWHHHSQTRDCPSVTIQKDSLYHIIKW